jgi:ABC-type bacteriocin/lantibiotic exporter with double-glycine peptidase domain
LTTAVATIAKLSPVIDMAKPIFETEPEISQDKQVIQSLSGSIELNNVTFRYSSEMPPVIDNLSLKIKPGEYVAIVGKTGCGKSTLLRLLLGFEEPEKGGIFYDGKDLSSIDLKSLRQKIGTVMQNGSLFTGDIYSNIAVAAPGLSIDDAWEAARKAGLADDIRKMPMGMATLVTEDGSNMSGGQKQRILIARAIAGNPRILMFDEATSSLDNTTQKNVCDALDKLKCTRIIIAHRLSTIRQCSRIILLENGNIKEEGTYDELMALGGAFYELVKDQTVVPTIE